MDWAPHPVCWRRHPWTPLPCGWDHTEPGLGIQCIGQRVRPRVYMPAQSHRVSSSHSQQSHIPRCLVLLSLRKTSGHARPPQRPAWSGPGVQPDVVPFGLLCPALLLRLESPIDHTHMCVSFVVVVALFFLCLPKAEGHDMPCCRYTLHIPLLSRETFRTLQPARLWPYLVLVTASFSGCCCVFAFTQLGGSLLM